MTITRADFLREQYITLRGEIKDTKDCTFKIAAIGLFILPAGQYVAKIMDAQFLLLFLPFLVISVALLYLSENHSLMRCGRYIRLHIESEIPNLIGWEKWLESRDPCEPRSVDRYVAYSIYLVLAAYYIASVWVSFNHCNVGYGLVPSIVLLGFYVAIGVLFVAYLVIKVRSTTTTALDPHVDDVQQLRSVAPGIVK